MPPLIAQLDVRSMGIQTFDVRNPRVRSTPYSVSFIPAFIALDWFDELGSVSEEAFHLLP
jgi:hypothetical protein